MADSYEAVVSVPGREMFREAFCRYMDASNFMHMSVGGRLGEPSYHEFKRNDDLVSLSFLAEGQSHWRVVVHSDDVPVELLVLDALTEGAADFLEPFCETLSVRSGEQILESLITDLRNAFQRVVSSEG